MKGGVDVGSSSNKGLATLLEFEDGGGRHHCLKTRREHHMYTLLLTGRPHVELRRGRIGRSSKTSESDDHTAIRLSQCGGVHRLQA